MSNAKKNDLEITICMGSSCFSRGGNKILATLQTYLKEQGLSDSITLKGTLCRNVCKKGPSIRINETDYHHVDPPWFWISSGIILKWSNIRKAGIS